MQALLDAQRRAFINSRPERLDIRRDRIERAIALLKINAEALCAAMSADFGNRSPLQSMMTDIAATVGFGRYCLKNLDTWAQASSRAPRFPLRLLGAKAELRFEPKGVVGIISPWNFPVNLTLSPLMQVFAAGNRAILKPSEFTERTSALMQRLVSEAFDPAELTVVTGGPDVAEAFTKLAFDHLVYTGSSAVGRKVMAAAAQNLVPVTLELGGKSPAIIGRGADLTKAGNRIALGKTLNAGQICLAPDYLLVPEHLEDGAIAAFELGVRDMYPSLLGNDDYASIVSDDHIARLNSLVADARDKGAEVIEINPASEDFSSADSRKMAPTVLRGVTKDMRALKEEIFGPILPVVTYRDIDEAIAFVNAGDRPLGLYYFGDESGERERVLTRTSSGGVTVNDTIFHLTVDDLPFGGVGTSGMGCYHGEEGFREFSHARGVYTQARVDVARLAGFKPPYGNSARKAARMLMK
ncbi:coniferyl aldehyde dehydrogenase [Aurantiacibacter spongiae]|uniref:Aldehyde dehydrogenase n=2 Tax=Aurantiacibacter spongiae TaxID=2488860 RepID=A0A3N5DCQ4_9SPHN|nr:coniferyl aldehyde dehydrogenase [Aurantiacibacter spongiae]